MGGFRLREAVDGRQGLEEFRRSRPDAVLLDLRMPGMDGLDVLSAMVEDAPETPVVVVSGAGTMKDAVEALRRGAWDFVVKPMYDPELLIRSFERALEKASLKRQNQEYRRNLEDANQVLARALTELRADQQGARLLQFQLLPRDGLVVGRHTLYRRLFPSQVLSGDFVDYFLLGDDTAGFYVADVSGHGAASAFVTAILTTLVSKYRQSLALSGDETVLDPARLLDRLDRDLSALPLDKHVTMFYGVLELQSGRLRYANAGLFPFPLVREGPTARVLECPGRPLALPGRGRAAAGELMLAANARMLVGTDGLLETGWNGQRDGQPANHDSARPATPTDPANQAQSTPLGQQLTQREKWEHVRRAFEESSGIEALIERLRLDVSAPLRDDVAVLYLGGTEVTYG
jgi:serine phosphatase RsbU (regulator of sigma subunit)